MKTRRRILSIVLTIAILLLLVLDIPVTAAGTKKVDVLFTHDTHSHLDCLSSFHLSGFLFSQNRQLLFAVHPQLLKILERITDERLKPVAALIRKFRTAGYQEMLAEEMQ